MNRKKYIFLAFGDYFVNIALSFVAVLVLAYILKYQAGKVIYSIIFTFSLFSFLYQRFYTVGKIDLRENSVKIKNALKTVAPLLVLCLALIGVYAIFKYNVLNTDGVVIADLQNLKEGGIIPLYLKDVVVCFVKGCFYNLSGFWAFCDALPFLFLINLIVIMTSALLGYYCGSHKIFLGEKFGALAQKAKDKFNE